jgi:hypothetical protein
MPDAVLVTETKRVAVVIVNWEGWQDTVVCLQSLDELTVRPTDVVVVDNGSSDASAERLVGWLREQGKDVLDRDGYDQKKGGGARPMRLQLISGPGEVRQSSVLGERDSSGDPPTERGSDTTAYAVLRLHTNCGFAVANNAGIRYLEASGRNIDYYWFLNNDTRVDKNALTYLLDRSGRRDNAGMYGSVVLDEQEPHVVQALGGAHWRGFMARAYHVGRGSACTDPWNPADIERLLSYIYGASMMVSYEFVARVGLMCEDYFLYYEELDWALRGKARGFALGFADKSIVYHKGGSSLVRVGERMGGRRRDRDCITIYYWTRGAVVTAWRWYPLALPYVLAVRWGKCLGLLLRGHRLGAKATALALLAPWRLLLPDDLVALLQGTKGRA